MEAKKNISDKLKLHSESVQKILSTSPHWMIRWGNTIVFIVLLLIILMSYFIKYPEYIRAPIIVTSQNRPEKIMEGDTAVTILPKEERFVGKMDIPIEDSLKVTSGQKVLIKFDNYPQQEYGVVEGKVQKITEASDKTGKYYVNVMLPKGLTISNDKNFHFDQELKGDAEIITKDVRLIERFFHRIR